MEDFEDFLGNSTYVAPDQDLQNSTKDQGILDILSQEQDDGEQNITFPSISSSETPLLSSLPPVSPTAAHGAFPLAEVLSAILVSYFVVILLVLGLRSYIARRGLTAECCGVSDEDDGCVAFSDCCSGQGDGCIGDNLCDNSQTDLSCCNLCSNESTCCAGRNLCSTSENCCGKYSSCFKADPYLSNGSDHSRFEQTSSNIL